MVKSFELVTVYRGGESATYLLKDFEKYGDEAEPLWVRQYPGKNAPFQKIKLGKSDGLMKHRTVSEEDIKQHKGGWDIKQLRKLLAAPK